MKQRVYEILYRELVENYAMVKDEQRQPIFGLP